MRERRCLSLGSRDESGLRQFVDTAESDQIVLPDLAVVVAVHKKDGDLEVVGHLLGSLTDVCDEQDVRNRDVDGRQDVAIAFLCFVRHEGLVVAEESFHETRQIPGVAVLQEQLPLIRRQVRTVHENPTA